MLTLITPILIGEMKKQLKMLSPQKQHPYYENISNGRTSANLLLNIKHRTFIVFINLKKTLDDENKIYGL